jgi:hypothetical protein
MSIAAMPVTLAPATYRTQPCTITALRFTRANIPALNDWLADELGEGKFYFLTSGRDVTLHIDTIEGPRDCGLGYWIIKGTQGEFYPCAPEVFADKYTFEAAL